MENIELSRSGSAALSGLHLSTDCRSAEDLCQIVLASVMTAGPES